MPFYYQGRCVGYTARKITEGKPKYISEQQPGYVFNLDAQNKDRQYVFVVEGPIDAITIDGVALTSADINQTQRTLIENLGKQIVVVPDRDSAGYRLVEQALEFGWGLSFPEWPDGIKDVNDAQQQLGRLAALYLIVQGIETNNLKQQLRARAWFKGI
jgi:DNA primase